ncbi:hypothetical protein Tco_0947768 [Tanacetum coccineum]
MEEYHKLLTDKVDESILRYNVIKSLPLGGPPSQVTIQSDFFFNKDLEYLRYGRKSGRPALSISKTKAAYYPDVGQRFYIDRHTSEGDRRAVRTHMRILSVVRIEVFSLYGYDYMKKIILRRADLKEYTIAERDFKYMYPSDFEDLYLLNLQGHLDHLPPEDKKILTTATQLNLTKPRWDATGFEFKHDFTVIDSPRAVTFRDKYGVQMIMRFNEIHKFSDGTLQQIDEALDYRTQAGTPPSMCQTISNIDAHVEGEQFHESKQSRSVLTDPKVHVKMEMEIPRSSRVNSQPHAHT